MATIRDITINFQKLDKLGGVEFRRCQIELIRRLYHEMGLLFFFLKITDS